MYDTHKAVVSEHPNFETSLFSVGCESLDCLNTQDQFAVFMPLKPKQLSAVIKQSLHCSRLAAQPNMVTIILRAIMAMATQQSTAWHCKNPKIVPP